MESLFHQMPKGFTQLTWKRANWVLASCDGQSTRAIAVSNGASDSFFGDRHHLLRLLMEGHMDCTEFTPAGVEFMRGLHCDIRDKTGRWYKMA